MQKTLKLLDVEAETKRGLGSLFYIKRECGCLNTVSSGKRHMDPNCPRQRRKTLDVNTKAAGGKFDYKLNYNVSNAKIILEILI